MKTSTFKNARAIVKALNDLDSVSRYLTLQLVDLGYVKVNKIKVTPGRGRAQVKYEVNGKGRGLQALAKNWK